VSVLAQGDNKSSVLLPADLQVDLRIVPAESYGNLLQHFTGSKQHNVLMREDAVRRGWSVSEWGLTNVESGRVHRFSNEDDVYRTLGYDPIPPELRQGADELTRAAAHELPTLLRHEDIQGDLHVHTEWSDGKLSVRAMVEAARARGYHYIAICDHSAGRRVGLSPERLPEQWEEIAKVQAALPELHILRGMEVDIKADATLDLPDEWLARLDFVIASIHSAMNQEEGQIMARLLGACRHPAVRAIGHPSGRLLERRQAYPVDYPALFLEAARTGTWLEVNSGPDRLDLDGARAREARAAGCTFMVSSDAHRLEELAWMRWGVATARRGWLEVQEVANAWPWERLQAALAARKEPGGRI
jgi:DNA polymerase (family 10)